MKSFPHQSGQLAAGAIDSNLRLSIDTTNMNTTQLGCLEYYSSGSNVSRSSARKNRAITMFTSVLSSAASRLKLVYNSTCFFANCRIKN